MSDDAPTVGDEVKDLLMRFEYMRRSGIMSPTTGKLLEDAEKVLTADAALDNPLVRAEVNRRYVAKEKVREILDTSLREDYSRNYDLGMRIYDLMDEKEEA